MTLAVIFGANVRRHRLAAGLSVRQVAHAAGMTARMLTAVEEGRHALVSLVGAEKLAEALDVHPLTPPVRPRTRRRPDLVSRFGLVTYALEVEEPALADRL